MIELCFGCFGLGCFGRILKCFFCSGSTIWVFCVCFFLGGFAGGEEILLIPSLQLTASSILSCSKGSACEVNFQKTAALTPWSCSK